MKNFTTNPKLSPIFDFFEKRGIERLRGLGSNYFIGLDESEKEEVWNFLSNRFALSTETISALYQLDEQRAVEAFKKEIAVPIAISPYPAEQEALEECRLLMLRYINRREPDPKYVEEMSEFAQSDFSSVRAQFAQFVPTRRVTRDAVDALKGMIFTETERLPLASAITKLMAIHGLDADQDDPLVNSIYMSLRSDKPKEKDLALKRLDEMTTPDYV